MKTAVASLPGVKKQILRTEAQLWPEYFEDMRKDTFFWGDRELRADDHFNVDLMQPLAKPAKVNIATDGADVRSGITNDPPPNFCPIAIGQPCGIGLVPRQRVVYPHRRGTFRATSGGGNRGCRP